MIGQQEFEASNLNILYRPTGFIVFMYLPIEVFKSMFYL